MNISILGSTRGSNLPGLYNGLTNTHVRIVGVISHKKDAGILEKARTLKLNCAYIPGNTTTFEIACDKRLHETKTEMIVLIGFMKILSPWFVQRWKNKIINVHPSLLPKYAGLMDLNVHQAVLDNHETETGCSVHYVTEEIDAGKVIVQKICAVLPNDTAESLKVRVQMLEVEGLIEALTV